MSIDTEEPAQKASTPRNKSGAFVDYIISRCHADKGARAALRRADNPATEYQSWEILAGFHVDLEYENQRLPHATVAAAIARADIQQNGTMGIGRAIARCYEEGNDSDQAKAKLRRLLACDSVPEACRILRPLLDLIESRSGMVLNYAGLLWDLLRFGHDDSQQRIKARWAQDFYGRPIEVEGAGHE
jgi:CRISPR system Cascade subunit CasB